MRTHQTTDSELRQQLKDEIAHFKELDTKKDALWRGNVMENLQEWEQVKSEWQDSADEIKHLHRKLYPYFPRTGDCPKCHCDTMPVLGSNSILVYQCIACGLIREGSKL